MLKNIYVCMCVHIQTVFFKQLYVTRGFCFSQCLMVPGKLKGKVVFSPRDAGR